MRESVAALAASRPSRLIATLMTCPEGPFKEVAVMTLLPLQAAAIIVSKLTGVTTVAVVEKHQLLPCFG